MSAKPSNILPFDARTDRVAKLRMLRRSVENLQNAPYQPASAGHPSSRNQHRSWQLGLAEIDQTLPGGGLCRDSVHEITAAYGDMSAAAGFGLALARGLATTAPVLWCHTAVAAHEFGAVYGEGLRTFGLDPQQFIFAAARHSRDVMWALEEGARCRRLAAVIGEVDDVSFTATRRLCLAAAHGRTPVLLLRLQNRLSASAARTRWRITARPGPPDPFDPRAPGCPGWYVELVRCQGGRPGAWTVEWNHETHRFCLAAGSGAGSPAARPEQAEHRQHGAALG